MPFRLLLYLFFSQRIDVNHVLTVHDLLVKDPKQQLLPENQISMTTLVYYYLMEQQFSNLFQLLIDTKNIEL